MLLLTITKPVRHERMDVASDTTLKIACTVWALAEPCRNQLENIFLGRWTKLGINQKLPNLK